MTDVRRTRAYYQGEWVYSPEDDGQIRRDPDDVRNDRGTGWGIVAVDLESRYGVAFNVGIAGGTVCLTAHFPTMTVCVTGNDGDLGYLDEWHGAPLRPDGTFHVSTYPPDDAFEHVGMGWGSDPLVVVDDCIPADELSALIDRAMRESDTQRNGGKTVTTPSPGELRIAADIVERLSAAQEYGEPERACLSPWELRREADRTDAHVPELVDVNEWELELVEKLRAGTDTTLSDTLQRIVAQHFELRDTFRRYFGKVGS